MFEFDGILLKPGLLQPGFHADGETSAPDTDAGEERLPVQPKPEPASDIIYIYIYTHTYTYTYVYIHI